MRNVTFHVPPQFDPTSDQSNVKMHDLTIEGGYASGCSDASYQLAPTATIIAGTGSGGIQISALGTLRLSNLSFTGFTSDIKIVALTTTALNARVTHVRFVNGRGVYFNIGASDSSIVVDNSLFAQQSPQGTPRGALNLWQSTTTDGLSARLTNNTITANTRDGIVVSGSTATVSLYDNILYGNGGSGDHDLVNVYSVLAIANLIGTNNGAYSPGSSSNLTSNPQFVSSTNYNIQTSSPAYDSGTSAVPGGLSAFDIEGEDRVVGGSVDRGAYENNNSGATILLVTNTNDSGAGSLRTAITDANANPVDNIIGFNISGACPRTISVNTELPAITGNLSIRGYTQPGSQPNTSGLTDNATICVALVEATGHTVTNGLRFAPVPNSTSQDVSGLAIGNFATAIRVDGPTSGDGVGCSIWGNFIGLAADGTTLRANSVFGVNVEGRSRCTIGGDESAKTNVIAGAVIGIRAASERTNYILNNYIGTTRSGNTARPNNLGVAVLSDLNNVFDNVISGNSGSGVLLGGTAAFANYLRGNRIGLKAFAICIPPCAPDYNALGNGGDGVAITDGASKSLVLGNFIAFNGGAGVHVAGTGSIENRIRGNSVHDNTGLGIDLGTYGVSPNDNDATAAAGTANRGLNFPELFYARGGNLSGSVRGKLESTNSYYTIEFYASPDSDPSGYGEGRTLVGSSNVTIADGSTSTDGRVDFEVPIASSGNLVGLHITALAFDAAGNTSEFSQDVQYEFSDVIFTNGFDDGGEDR